jgi:MerR family mercuric resistance operon transcriptional regulator
MYTKPRAPLMIGTLSDHTGVNIETIRYYERAGLLPPPPRTQGKHRVYDEFHIQRLAFIKRGRDLGFSLDDIRALLRLAENGDTACATTKGITLRHLADIHGKIASLKRLERALKEMTDACAPGTQRSCPIIDALSAVH